MFYPNEGTLMKQSLLNILGGAYNQDEEEHKLSDKGA
jgi:hypothetical protein